MSGRHGARLCAMCEDATSAPFGYRRPGPAADLPEGKRGSMWVCAGCIPAAEAMRECALSGVWTEAGRAAKARVNVLHEKRKALAAGAEFGKEEAGRQVLPTPTAPETPNCCDQKEHPLPSDMRGGDPRKPAYAGNERRTSGERVAA